MKKIKHILIPVLIFLLTATYVRSDTGYGVSNKFKLNTRETCIVTNVNAQQRAGTKLVDVTYDLSDADGDFLTIMLLVSNDGGSSYTITPVTLTGDVGSGVAPGTSKSIVWDAGSDYPNQYGTSFQVKVIIGVGQGGIETSSVTDMDGNVYNTVKIGSQEWMVENLKVTRYRNGDDILNVTDILQWTSLTSGAYCTYNNDSSKANTYGHLYNWYAVDDSRGLAPAGWRVPTDDDWKELEIYLGMDQSEVDIVGNRGAAANVGEKLKETGTAHWNSPNTLATNESGFTALPGGSRNCYSDTYINIGYSAFFWLSSEETSNSAWFRLLKDNRSSIYRHITDKKNGFSVRCVRDFCLSNTFTLDTRESTGIDRLEDVIPMNFKLSQNYPNPFNPSTTIKYKLPKVSDIEIIIYNIKGQFVKTLVNRRQVAGNYEIKFDASSLSSGIYFCNVKSGKQSKTIKMLYMK
ncbi:FISUMP domain-containing protein [candidate division KSB1 bacterium]